MVGFTEKEERHMQKIYEEAISALLKLHSRDLSKLDKLVIKSYLPKGCWSPIGRCIRIAICIKDHELARRQAKTKSEKQYHTRRIGALKQQDRILN